MPTQTLSITATGNDGYEEAGAFTTTDPIFYENNAGGPTPGLSFTVTTEIPAGATINPSYVRMFCSTGAGPITGEIGVEDADPASNTAWSGSHLPESAAFYTQNSTGSITFTTSQWYFGSADNNPINIAAALQSLLNEYGTIAVGERINIRLNGTAGSGSVQFEDFANAGSNEAELFIDWTAGAGTPSISRVVQNYFLNGQTSIVVTGASFEAAQGAGMIRISPTDSIADGGIITQTVTAWGDTSATFTAVRSTLGQGVLYLFVTNNTGNSNASGYPVVFINGVSNAWIRA